jgi:hypothetical protein
MDDFDFVQWKALTRAALKLDFRVTSLHPAMTGGRTPRVVVRVIGPVIVYALFGLLLVAVILLNHDLFFIGTLSAVYTMFVVGTSVLLDHNAALVSPADYAILGFRPVSSRTYFLVRLSNVLAYTVALTTAVVWLPLAVLFLRHGAAVGVAGVAALYAAAVSTALAILIGYAAVVRVIQPQAVRNVLSFVQLGMSTCIYGGYFVLTQSVASRMIGNATLPKAAWMLAVPPVWFAAYLELANGRHGAMELTAAALSLLAIGAMAASIGGRLSFEYSERLAALLADSAAKARPMRRSWWFNSGEARAVALLVRTHFRNDQRFRMGVLSILPMTLLYVVLGVRDGGMHDPFVRSNGSGPSLINIAILMFPSVLSLQLRSSESYRASWIFFATPADRVRAVRASKNVLLAFFLIPYLMFVAAIYAYVAGNLWHVVVHMAMLGLLSHLMLQIAMVRDPDLPFSKPVVKQQQSWTFFGFMAVMFGAAGLLNSASADLYSRPIATLIAFAATVVASAVVDRMTRARIERQSRDLEFAG